MEFREAIERDAQDLQALAAGTGCDPLYAGLQAALAACGNDYREQEQRLDAAAMELRRTWLGLAHRPADAMLKSPREGKVAHVPCGDRVRFGYERDLDASLLEDRGASYLRPPAGWSSDLVLHRSGQAALASFLQFAAARWGREGSLTIAHAGAYFETASLLDTWPQRVFRQVPASSVEAVDIVIVEPVSCDGCFSCVDRLPPARRAILLDTTMVGPGHDLARYLPAQGDSCSLVIAYNSGLKLDQAGLELANVGIVRILAREDCGEDAASVGAALRHIRSLTGSGLTLDELSALSAPWFMDRDYVDRYTAAIFANNRALAQSIGTTSAVFAGRCHPSLLASDADAPFCAIELNDPRPGGYQRLASLIERESARRGLLATKGGSFGFRGHRYELIEPDPGQGRPFLRVAMGWRAGYSCQGLCELFAELAAKPSFAAIDASPA